MDRFCFKNIIEWSEWLKENHSSSDGIWFVYFKKHTGKECVEYSDSLDEALCWGWIDSLIKKIDDDRYCRKFTPRKLKSKWSEVNKRKVEKLIGEGRMTEHGMKIVEAAKNNGMWNSSEKTDITENVPEEFADALSGAPEAEKNFNALPASNKKRYLGWIFSAKRAETVAKRIREAVDLLKEGKNPGMK